MSSKVVYFTIWLKSFEHIFQLSGFIKNEIVKIVLTPLACCDLNSRVSQFLYLAKNVTLASERYMAEFLYMLSLDIGSYKTAV